MGIPQIQPPVIDVVRRIESEYREMPGLCLTAAQAQRLWGLDHATCLRVLTLLVSRRILKRTKTGLYLRAR
jgi:Fic family protein